MNYYAPMYRSELIEDIKERLKRRVRAYKSTYLLDGKRRSADLYSQLITVDFDLEKYQGKLLAEMSFTFLHWRIMELIIKGELDIRHVHQDFLEMICFNILPGG